MAAAYFENDFRNRASFELFVRSLPPERSFLIAAGLEQALEYLEQVRFLPADIDYLRHQPVFAHVSDAFFDYLKEFRFTGEAWAMAEGTAVFGEEPLLRVTAPIIEAQIVETFLLSILTFQTMIASKAARIVAAADGRNVVEFGTRRAHGPEAGVLAARAAYIAGCAGTSNVEAGQRFGIPIFGTLAHSFVMAYSDEEEAFRRFQQLFPDHAVLLIDTYDTVAAARMIASSGLKPRAVRLDSGDVGEQAHIVRAILDDAGLRDVRIVVSGDLDEYAIDGLVARGAPVDAFGVGTKLGAGLGSVERGIPGGTLSLVYKLASIGDRPVIKTAPGKDTWPGRKQVARIGRFERDVIMLDAEPFGERARPLLDVVVRGGSAVELPSLEDARARAAAELASLPERYRAIRGADPYPIEHSHALQRLREVAAAST
jgi:nicotinate phosphoribosyltransferase